jgi:hypothetical protein
MLKTQYIFNHEEIQTQNPNPSVLLRVLRGKTLPPSTLRDSCMRRLVTVEVKAKVKVKRISYTEARKQDPFNKLAYSKAPSLRKVAP